MSFCVIWQVKKTKRCPKSSGVITSEYFKDDTEATSRTASSFILFTELGFCFTVKSVFGHICK